MIINFVLPALKKDSFSGGALCLINYANGLASIGHVVNVITYVESESPEWFKRPWGFNFISPSKSVLFSRSLKSSGLAIRGLLKSALQAGALLNKENKANIRDAVGGVATLLAQRGSYGISKGAVIENLQMMLPDADITIASDFETAYAVALVGKGKRCYFSQHYEPFFWKERLAGEIAKREAELSYQLGLIQIVNSPWLASELKKRHHIDEAFICSNAIDHDTFKGDVKTRSDKRVLKVISYGGRDAEWKGFREMCEGVRLAREQMPNITFEWQVYGTALLPPDNNIAPYQALGFLNQAQLVAAYQANDVLLSASWYESFPLFPIEAMASGIATICTSPGTEVYAEHGDTVEIVQPQSPESIAASLIRLANDEPYRFALAQRGQIKAQEFTWDRSIKRMSEILCGL